jgi:hypothetical protein
MRIHRLALAALLTACAPPRPAPVPAAPTAPAAAPDTPTLRTDRARYSEYDVVGLTFRPAEEIRVDLCRPRLERRAGGVWSPAPPLKPDSCSHSAPTLLPAGREVTVWWKIPPAYPLGEYRFTSAVEGGAPLASAPFAIVQHPLLAGLVLQVRAGRASAAPGDTVRLFAVARNLSHGPLDVGGACGPAMDVSIRAPAGDSVLVLNQMVGGDAVFDCMGHPEYTLAPGDSLVERLWWRAPRVRGEYTAVAHSRRYGGVRPTSAPLRITVR